MLEPGKAQRRIDIPYLEGVNSLVSFNIGKKTELIHAENARSKMVGTIEKREGQTVLGVNLNNKPFVTSVNYGLFSFQNNYNRGFYRISALEDSSISVKVVDNIGVIETSFPSTLSIFKQDSISVKEQINNNTGNVVTIYYINGNNQWVPLSGNGTNIPGGIFDYSYAEGCVFLVNQNSDNRYITADGSTVITSTTGMGHLYNTPSASRVNFYKNRLYLGDFVKNGIRYPTTILRSSYPVGLICLLNADYTAAVSGSTLDVTDTKYLYETTGANVYDIYRGETLITTITITKVNESSIVATWSGTPNLLASDEIWLGGTYNGTKYFRWVNNPTSSGRDVKQYDTMKLSGGENEPITVLTNIGNVMLAANKSSMLSWNDYTLENFDLDIGCVSKKGYVKMIGTFYFLHYTGIYATSGGVPNLISNKIEKYITGATKAGKEASAAGKKGRSIFFTLGDVSLYNSDGSLNKILKDVCVEYNLVQENWYVHTNVKSSEFATFIESVDSDRLEFLDTDGNKAVKEFLNGETDDGNVIHFRIDTMKLTMGINQNAGTSTVAFEYSSKPIALLTEVERGTSMQVFANLDKNEEFYPLEGTMGKGLSVIKFKGKDEDRGKPPYCRLVSLSIRDSSKQLCKLSRMSIIYLPTTDEDNPNTKE